MNLLHELQARVLGHTCGLDYDLLLEQLRSTASSGGQTKQVTVRATGNAEFQTLMMYLGLRFDLIRQTGEHFIYELNWEQRF